MKGALRGAFLFCRVASVALLNPFKSSTSLTAAALAVLAALAAALYLPYLGNPAFFDDRFLFSGQDFAHHALFPFGLGLRHPAYFSLAFVQTIFGSIEAHRVVSLLFHISCAWALYALLRALEVQRLAAFAGAALFAVHPVAVYGAGYLVQRSIVLATLFSLLALLLFLRGVRTGRISDAIPAAVLYSLAVLSKEHAILLPAAAVLLLPLRSSNLRFAARYAASFLLLCVPGALFVLLRTLGVIGVAYEPHLESIVKQISATPGIEAVTSPWSASMLVQAALFFRYLWVWLVPGTASMAIDLRVNFADYWAPSAALPAVFCFVTLPVLAAFLLLRRGRAGLAAWGFLYFWILFGTEFAAVRLQEPFVLYRSYLWAPGIVVAVAAGIDRLPRRLLIALLIPALALLVWEARDRLNTFSSGLAVWEDAAAKLPDEPVPGGYRPLYELGREYLYAGRPEDAVEVNERCVRLYPRLFECAFARAAIQIETRQYDKALPSINYALGLRPRDGASRHHLGLVLENLGCRKESLAQYRLAIKLGFPGAEYRLQHAESPGKGLLAPMKLPPQADCAELLRRNPIPKPG
jgi:tetratricopeptide (TPR) repeat protein